MKLSIITINRNNAAGLEKTIQSVVCQTSADFEYIVIDGNSDDGSVDIIKKYVDKINYWVSEPDAGIFNAMNKGIRKATGDYCLFLNSGDWLIESKTLQNVSNEIDCSADVYYSNFTLSNNEITIYSQTLDINDWVKGTINHQNTLIRRSLFIEHGFYNESLKITSDWEFFLREAWLYKIRFVHIKTNISVYDINGITSRKLPIEPLEKKTVYKNIFGGLGESFIELYEYRRGVYSDIVKRWGYDNIKTLEFFLRIYNKMRKIIDMLFKKNRVRNDV